MEEKIRVLVKEPGKEAELREIPNTLEDLQSAVGGYIKTVTFAEDCTLVVNEEGKLKGLPMNFRIFGDVIVGTAVLAGVDGEEFCSLTDEQVQRFKIILPGMWDRCQKGKPGEPGVSDCVELQ